jgi:S1-C subfamily serine protease
MEARRTSLVRAAEFATAALVGGAVALGGASALGRLGGTKTVREVRAVPVISEPARFAQSPAQPHALSIHEIYSRSAPGVVQVTTTAYVQQQDPFGFPLAATQQSQLGSGFVIDKAGHVITNYHVINDADSVEVSFSNNESVRAYVVGADPSTDIAVLQVKRPSRAFTALPMGDSDAVKVGDAVVAIGNPFGLERTVTAGIVSALQRQIQAPNEYSIDHVIQTDAPINHGNSGGPLLNTLGQVIGVNAQISTGGSGNGNVGIGFAIPINTVKSVAAQVIQQGRVEHASIGINGSAIEASLARLFRLPVKRGVLVEAVGPDSGAAKAGVRAGTTQVTVAGQSHVLGGDIIVAADGEPVSTLSQLRTLVAAKRPGDTMKLDVYRGDKKLTLQVKLGRLPNTPTG